METSEKNNIKNNELRKELVAASLTGDFETVRLLLESDLNQNTRNTALIAASESNRLNIVQLLLEKGADPNYVGSQGTAFDLAIQRGHFGIVRYFLDKKPELFDCQNGGRVFPIIASNGEIALIAASHQGHFDMVRYLLEKKPTLLGDVNSYGSNTPLMAAIREGHFNIIKYLLKKLDNSDQFLDRANLNGDTVLMLASATGNANTVRSLLDHGANPNYVNKQGTTALFIAAQNNQLAVVRLLLSRGAIITNRFRVNFHRINKRLFSVSDVVQRSQKLSLISNFFERNPELWLIPRNQHQTVREWQMLYEVADQTPILDFFERNPRLSLIPSNLKQAVTEILIRSKVINQVPASEMIRACHLIRPYYDDTSAYIMLTKEKLIEIVPIYRTILAVVLAFKANRTPTNKDLVTAQDSLKKLPPELMFLIIKQAMQNCLAKGLARMAQQYEISETLLSDTYYALQTNSPRLKEFSQALAEHDWCQPWVRSTASTTLRL